MLDSFQATLKQEKEKRQLKKHELSEILLFYARIHDVMG